VLGCFRWRTINFKPDQVSSIAHTFTSTNPSGSATARTTSSVTSVGTPDDRFGQEPQTTPVFAIFSRKTDNLVANSLRFVMKRWTKLEPGFKRSEKVTPSGIVPSNRRKFFGALIVTTIRPGLIPSFCVAVFLSNRPSLVRYRFSMAFAEGFFPVCGSLCKEKYDEIPAIDVGN
jgi:hypothetical protein